MKDKPKYLRERPLYSNRSQPRYQKAGNNSQNRYQDESNKIILSLGVVGEQVGASSARRGQKGNSLDMRLPKIGEGMIRGKNKGSKEKLNSINSIKLPNLQKYKHGKNYLNNQKIYSNKYSSKNIALDCHFYLFYEEFIFLFYYKY